MRNTLLLIVTLFITIEFNAQNSNFNWVNTYSTGKSYGNSIAVDNQGFVYTAGSFENTVDFNSTGASSTLTSAGSTDVFITKTDSLGNLIWAKRIGSLYGDGATAIMVDHVGNIIIGGSFTSQVDFNPGSGTFNMTVLNGMASAFSDAFILKLDANGNFIWAKQLNYNIIDAVLSMCEDKFGNLIVGGSTYTSPSNSAFVAKLNSTGTVLWSKIFYSTNDGTAQYVDTDSNGNIFCSGLFYGKCYFGAVADTLSSQAYSSFVCSLSSNGLFKWVKQTSSGTILKVDNNDILNVTGGLSGTSVLGAGVGSLTITSISTSDILLIKMDTLGAFLSVKQIGGNSGGAFSYTHALDSIGNHYISGEFSGTFDFDSGIGVFNLNSSLGSTFFLKLDSIGDFVWANQIGHSSTNKKVYSTIIDKNNNLYSTGHIYSTVDFDPSIGQYNVTPDNFNAFVLRLGNCMNPITPINNTPLSKLSTCSNISTTLSASGIGILSWYSSPTSTLSLASSPTFTTPPLPAGTYTYYVESKICNSSSLRTPIVYTVNALPTLTIVPSSTVACSGSSITISATGVNSYTIAGNGVVNGNTVWPNQNPTSNFTVTGTDINGCVNNKAIAIPIVANPNLSISTSTNSFCYGPGTATISASGALTYTWSNSSNASTIVVTPTVTTTYTVLGSNANNCVSSITQTIYVNAIPNASISGATNTTCVGAGNIWLTGAGSNYTYWYHNDQNQTQNTSSTIYVTPTVTSTYTFYTKSAVTNCTNTAVYTITVFPVPSVTITPSSSVICSGSSCTLSATGANTYEWFNTASTLPVAVVSPTVNTVYSIFGYGINGCSAVKHYTVSVSTPYVNINPNGGICIGNTATLTASGATSYTWNPVGINSNSIVVSPTISTNYFVIGTNSNGCVASNSLTLNVTGSNVSYAISSNPICEGLTATITGFGASSYTWNPGGITATSIAVTPTINTTYTMNTVVNTCPVVKIILIAVNTLPIVVVTGSNTVCIGTNIGFTANGADTYTWNTGQTTPSISISPTVSTIYTVTGTDVNGCANTETISVTVDNTCQDVWPGDANSDGTADNLDVLELGLHYTQTGAPRAATSNNWQSYFANNWAGTITNGKNLNHSDCNGDGIINDDDTLAIYNNYGLTHTFKPAQTNTVNAQLSIVPDQAMVTKGNWGTASVYLGDATNTINNINGVAFTVDFDNTLIEPNSIYMEYLPSFIDASQNLYFRKLDFANSKLYTATTHTVNNNVGGFGKIATLHYQILSSLTTDNVLNIGLSQANQSDASGAIAPLTSGTGTLMAIGASVGVKESAINGNVMISPNPTNGVINIVSTNELQFVEVTTIAGQVLLKQSCTDKSYQLQLQNLADGVYFVKVVFVNGSVVVRKVVKQ